MKLDEEVREFLIESSENLANLDREIVLLEENPKDAALIASVFRTIHTIKGTCGFFEFNTLGAVTHIAESILDQVRTGMREWTPQLTSVILETVDAVKVLLITIESEGTEGTNEYTELRQKLNEVFQGLNSTSGSAAEAKPAPAIGPVIAVAPQIPPARQENDSQAPISVAEVVRLSTVVATASVPQEVPTTDAGSTAAIPSKPTLQTSIPTADPARSESNVATEANVSKNSAVTDSTIRVDVNLLDKLMNLVGELVLARNQLLQGTAGQDATLIRTVQRLNVITSELQEGVLKTRMQPIGVVWNKLPRVIRDLATECGKRIQLEMEGAETELDKTIIEAIKDPLTHIVRNSCDHGIESPEARIQKGKLAEGLVLLRAYHEGGHVIIEISDDGGGLNAEKLKARALQKGLIRPDQAAAMPDREAVQLVFLPGFSTAEQVTKISGRGVGMDVVKTNIQKIGGMVDIFNRPGDAGSTVKIKIPLTLAIIPGLVIKAICDKPTEASLDGAPGAYLEHQFVIPQASLLELVRLEGEERRQLVEYVNGTPVFRRRGHLLPLAYLSSVLGISGSPFPTSDVVNIVVLQAEDRPFGLIVDGISDTQEIVVKPLGKRLKGLSSYLGSTIMGDGRVALILDVPGLARLAGIVAQSRELKKPELSSLEIEEVAPQTLLIFQSGSFTRLAVPLVLVSRLEQFSRKSIEMASGRPVLYYRDQILPLLALDRLLDAEQLPKANDSDSIQVIVFGEDSGRIGIVVDQIVDIIEAAVTFTQSSRKRGLLGSAVVGGIITDLLDLQAVIECAGEDKRCNSSGPNTGPRLLIVDSSSERRTLLCSYLAMRGYRTKETTSVQGALDQLESSALAAHGIDLVITSLTPDSEDKAQKIFTPSVDLLATIRASPAFGEVPVIAVLPHGSTLSNSSGPSASTLKFDAVEMGTDREKLVQTIESIFTQKKLQAAA